MKIFDLHEDIADSVLYTAHGDFWKRNDLKEGWNDLGIPVNNQSDFVRLQEGNVSAIFGVSCAFGVSADGKIIPSNSHKKDTTEQVNLYLDFKKQKPASINTIKSKKDLNSVADFDLSILLAIEGADSIQSKEVLEEFFDLGVRSIGLTWSYDNALAGGCAEGGQLTEIGKEIIKHMESLGILLDLAHISEKSHFEALSIVSKPTIVSHTCCKGVYDNERNLTDDQIVAVAETGGLVGICGIARFVGPEDTVELDDLMNHFDHAISLVGIDSVGIGSDMGAMTSKRLIPNFSEVSDMPHLVEAFRKRGYKEEEIEKVAYKNIERVLREVLPG